MDKQYNIVIFEDSDADYFLIEQMFAGIQSSKYQLFRVETMADYEALDIDDISLIIMDYHLRGDSGLDYIARLKAQDGAFAPFIFLTGVDNPSLYEELKKLGVFDYFIKSEMTISLLERACFYAIERFEAARKYNKEREFSKYLIENLDYQVIEIDADGVIKRSNESYKKFKTNILANVSKDVQDAFEDQLKSKTKGFYFEFNIEKKIVHTKWQCITSNFSESYTYIGEDITAQVEQKESEIARQRLQALGHLAGGIAHELNNTMQPMILRNDILHEIGMQMKNEDILEHTRENQVMLTHACAIIRDILTFSNSQGDDPHSLEDNLIDSVESVIALVQKSLPHTVSIQTNLDRNLDHYNVAISQNDLFKMLSNIVHNAALSMNNIGVINVSVNHIQNEMENATSMAALIIEDEGCGMDKDTLKNIFSPFYTTRAPGEGTGLGMSVVHAIVQKLDGDIKIDSQLGKGTRMSVYLPVTPI